MWFWQFSTKELTLIGMLTGKKYLHKRFFGLHWILWLGSRSPPVKLDNEWQIQLELKLSFVLSRFRLWRFWLPPYSSSHVWVWPILEASHTCNSFSSLFTSCKPLLTLCSPLLLLVWCPRGNLKLKQNHSTIWCMARSRQQGISGMS